MFLLGSMAGVGPLITGYPVYGGQAVRYAVAGLVLLTLARIRRLPLIRPGRRELALLMALAAVGLVAFNVFKLAALRHAAPAVVGTMLATVPILLAVFGPLAVGRRPSRRLILAGAVVATGAILTTGFGSTDAAGVGYALAMLACEVGFSLLAVPLLGRLGPLRTSAYAMVAAVPMLVVAGVVADGRGFLRMPELTEAVAFGYITVFVTVVAFLLWYGSLPVLGADRAGLFAGFVPVGAILTGLAVGTSVPSYADLAGAGIVLTGILFGLRPARRRVRLDHVGSRAWERGGRTT